MKLHKLISRIFLAFLTSSPEGAIFKYSLTSLEFKITLIFVKSIASYDKTRSGMRTEKRKKSVCLFFLQKLMPK